jgi:hypothetical protein
VNIKLLVLALLSTVPIACGSSQPPAASPASSQAEAQKSADDIWNDAWSAYGKAPTITESETETESNGTVVTIQIDATPTSMSFTTTANGQSSKTVIVNNKVYTDSGTGFQVAAADYATAVLSLLPPHLASCQTTHGTLTKGSTTSVDGVQVVEVKDDGKSPGDIPGSIFVAVNGSPLIVQSKGGGVSTTGGRPDCAAAPGFSTYDIHFTYPTTPSQIVAPSLTTGT